MKVVLAARASTKEQGTTIETQDERAREWASREGHEVVAVVADVKSGTVAPWDRKNLRDWVTKPEKMALYDGILAYRNDRLSRGAWDDETRIRQWAQEHNKVLMIADGPQWPPRHDGDFWAWTSLAKQARSEWEDIRERTMRAMGKLRDNGKLVGRPVWGYRTVGERYDHSMEPTEEGRRIMPEVYRRCVAGDSLRDICVWMESETGRQWWPRVVGRMIRNPSYIGHRVNAAGVTIMRCEPLIDAGTFRIAGEILDGRPKRGPVREENRPVLSRVLFCMDCEEISPMYRIKPRGDDYWYRCTGRGPQRKGCGNMVRLDWADACVSDSISRWDDEITQKILVPGHDWTADIEGIRFEMRQLMLRNLPDEEMDRELVRLRAERDRLQALPADPDRIEEIGTGRTYAALWASLENDVERNDFLLSQGVKVQANREGISISKPLRGPVRLVF